VDDFENYPVVADAEAVLMGVGEPLGVFEWAGSDAKKPIFAAIRLRSKRLNLSK